jgi:large-conductance mechanosensitive channel
MSLNRFLTTLVQLFLMAPIILFIVLEIKERKKSKQ